MKIDLVALRNLLESKKYNHPDNSMEQTTLLVAGFRMLEKLEAIQACCLEAEDSGEALLTIMDILNLS